MSAPRRWARRAMLSVLAGGGLTAGLGGSLPGAAVGAEAPAGAAGSGEGSTTPVTTNAPQAPTPAQGASGVGGANSSNTAATAPAPSGASATPAPSGTSTGASGTATAPTEAAGAPAAEPTVVVQRQQRVTSGTRRGASTAGGGGSAPSGSGGEGAGTGGKSGGGSGRSGEGTAKSEPGTVSPGTPNGVAPAPQAAGGELSSTLLLDGSVFSAQALDFYRIPLFLLPLYKAAAFQYDIPWQVLAAINEVETNYGTDQSVSTAGAVGWMQFMPSTWLGYGVDATDAGYADPYNPADAIFAAARYLHAAGASRNLDAAILAYNHSQEYVESVLLRARLIASFPRSVIGTLTGLVDGRAPTPDARVVPGAAAGLAGGSLPGGASPSAPAAAGSQSAPGGAGGASNPTAGAVPAPTPTSAAAASTGALAMPKPAPPPRVAAAHAEAAANAPAKVSQLTDVLGAPGAPVVAVEDGRIMHLGRTHGLGRYLVLRDIYGDIFTYAGLGSIAHRYRPAQGGSTESGPPKSARASGEPSRDPAPTLSASAGHQPPVTLKVRAHVAQALAPASGRAGRAGRAGTLIESAGETAPPGMGRVRLFAHPGNPIARAAAAHAAKSASTGNGRWLTLRTGSIVSEGTVLGHLDTPAGASPGRLRFAVRPAGDNGTIDPQPLLENWKQLAVALHPKGSRGTGELLGATAGDALLMSKEELERAVLADPGIGLDACGRRDVTAGVVDARVLAVLEFLSRSGLQPTVAGLRCPRGGRPSGLSLAPGVDAAAARAAHDRGTAVDITAINGVAIAGHQGEGTIADAAIRTLLTLRGRFAPHRIVSLMKYSEAPTTTQALPSAWDHIRIDFLPLRPATANAASTHGTTGPAAASPLAVTGDLNEAQWSELIGRIAALPRPVVATRPSGRAIRDPQAAPTNRALGARGLAAGA